MGATDVPIHDPSKHARIQDSSHVHLDAVTPPTAAARQTHARVISTSPLQVTPQLLLQPLPRLAHAAFRETGSNILLSVLPSCPVSKGSLQGIIMVLRDAAAHAQQQHAGPAGTDKDKDRAALPATRRSERCLPSTPSTTTTSSSSKSSNTPLLHSVTRRRRRSGGNEAAMEPAKPSLAGERTMSPEEYSALPRSIQYVPSSCLPETRAACTWPSRAFACLLHQCLINTGATVHVIRTENHMCFSASNARSILPLQ